MRKIVVNLIFAASAGFCFTFSLLSCSVDPGILNRTTSSQDIPEYNTPYASIEELDEVTNGTRDYIYWRIARTFALIELEGFRVQNSWQNAKLSERPVMIYDAKSRLKYYEFRVIQDGKETGAVTTTAQKKDGGPVAFVLPSVGNYNETPAKSFLGNAQIIANGYPNIAYGTIAKSGGDVIYPMDADGNGVNIEQDPLEIALNNPELFTNSNFTVEMVRSVALNIIASNSEMWSGTENIMSNFVIFSTNDEQVAMLFQELAAVDKTMDFDGGRIVGNNNQLTANGGWWDIDWVVSKLHWNSSPYKDYGYWCGPTAAAIALCYYGYTEKIVYDDKVLHIPESIVIPYDGYKELGYQMGLISEEDWIDGGVSISEFQEGVDWASSGNILYEHYNPEDWYFGDGSWWANAFGCTTYDKVKSQVENDDLTMIARPGHARIGFGYKKNDIMLSTAVYGLCITGWWWIFPIFSWCQVGTRWDKIGENRFILITDNNYESQYQPYSDFIQKRYSNFSPYIFWENTRNNNYAYFSVTMFRRK